MSYLEQYITGIENKGNPLLAESVKKTSEKIGEKHLSKFSYISHETGLLFGNIQSGKTAQMLGIVCKAADMGFRAFLLLTTDNKVLQEQTLERVKQELKGFCICGENDDSIFVNTCLTEPTIIVVKKNVRVLKKWATIFSNTSFMVGNPLFIIDDEADAASLNTFINKKGQSSINKYLDKIKNGASSSLYLQVTGTPQAIFLQEPGTSWHPLFVESFDPGNGYLGGDFFYPKEGKPDCVTFSDQLDNPERQVVIRHITVSALIFAANLPVSNCLIHPSSKQATHEATAYKIRQELEWCRKNFNDRFLAEFIKLYENLRPCKFNKPIYSKVYEAAKKILENETYEVIILNGTTDVKNSEYSIGCNFIVGGNSLGRGVTFPRLNTIYYTRSSKKPQADTMWQHSRMFGYDRDPGLMMVYMDEKLYKLFSDINATNSSIVSQIKNGVENVKVYYPENINPTRKCVIDKEHVITLSGGTNYYPDDPENNTVEQITKLLEPFSEKVDYYQVSLKLEKEVLKHICPSPDFKLASFLSVIEMFLLDDPGKQSILIVRRNRKVTQGTGALLSPNDWKLCNSFDNMTVLTMYQIEGDAGWKQNNLWVPNIKLPGKSMYYDFDES